MSVLAVPVDRPRLLIVDDQPANIRIMAEALGDAYELFFATTGAKALEIAAGRDIELVLLDVVMPDLDGFEVCRRLKSDARTSRIPIVFVTAREEISDETRGFDVGGVDYIAKPIRPPIVRARVRTHVELKRARDLLETIASVDALTGVANRRQFDLRISEEWKRASRGGDPLSLALLDVDFFKNFNDTYGHARGDACLRAVAGAIASVVQRPGDVVARYGGEEFAVILPGTDAAGAAAIFARILGAVRSLAIPHAASACGSGVSISGGGVSLSTVPGLDQTYVMGLADELLYEAKKGGRDHFVHLDHSRDTKTRIAPGA